MTSLSVVLSLVPPPSPWPASSPLSLGDSGATLHLPADNSAQPRKVQLAARRLATMGFTAATLDGVLWSAELQWAFAQGFARPQPAVSLTFCGDQAEALTNRWRMAEWVRKVTHQSPAECTPLSLCDQAEQLIRELAPTAAITCQRWVGHELADAGFVGIHQVGVGSANPPVLLQLDINPSGNPNEPVAVALVGKGITFDSGGYSMKTSQGMLHMKADMGGAATVTAALGLALLSGLQQRVRLILCCAENLVSERAYKLGDVLAYRNGVTVEIVNTDAEGRLVLADGLLLAAEGGPRRIIDAATLTGAAVVALGNEFNALFALDEQAANAATTAATACGEPLWRLPLATWHRDQCPSDYALTANSRPVAGGGPGGASNAAGFLSRFVANDGAGWLHFDLAASYRDSGNGQWAAGATALGIATIAALTISA